MQMFFNEVLKVIQELQAFSQRDQFLMKLRLDYETVWSTLMNWAPLPSLNNCLDNLWEE